VRGLGQIPKKIIPEELHNLKSTLVDADVNVDPMETFIVNVKANWLREKMVVTIASESQIIKMNHDTIDL
jgi:signal recognition particle GTPase